MYPEKDSFKACCESIRVDVKFDFQVLSGLKKKEERLVYLFITQPDVKYVSVVFMADMLGISQKDALLALVKFLRGYRK